MIFFNICHMSWLDFVAERSSIKQFRKVKSEKVLNIFIIILDYLEYTLITNCLSIRASIFVHSCIESPVHPSLFFFKSVHFFFHVTNQPDNAAITQTIKLSINSCLEYLSSLPGYSIDHIPTH